MKVALYQQVHTSVEGYEFYPPRFCSPDKAFFCIYFAKGENLMKYIHTNVLNLIKFPSINFVYSFRILIREVK